MVDRDRADNTAVLHHRQAVGEIEDVVDVVADLSLFALFDVPASTFGADD